MCSARDDQTLLWPGCPIRRSAGRRLFSASPRLIAAVHVLHRLLVPRHPPCALNILTEIHTTSLSLCRFQGTRKAMPRKQKEPRQTRARSFKTEQRCPRGTRSGAHQTRSTCFPGSASNADPRCWSPHVPRKEVIQPHLPVRLPCYDFTPITKPTFDGSLPCGLSHRLRVFLAFVV